MCDNEGIGNINLFLIAMVFFLFFFFVCFLFNINGFRHLQGCYLFISNLVHFFVKDCKRQNIMFNLLNLFIWNIIRHIKVRYVTQKENCKPIRTSFVTAGNYFNT